MYKTYFNKEKKFKQYPNIKTESQNFVDPRFRKPES